MPKNLKQWILSAMVPDGKTHAVEEVLAKSGASEVMWRPVLFNGVADEAPKTPKSVKEISELQQHFIMKHARGTFTTKELMPAWKDARLRPEGLYGALAKAAQDKVLKKIGPGKYKRIS